MAALNYATEYSRALSQKFPYVLNFGALYSTPNNGRYRWVNAKTIEIPSITTTGRVNGDRDSIAQAARHYDNAWESKTLSNERKWSTLVHPMDVQQTNMVTTIANITQVFNEEQKFPEMDAYTVSKIYADYAALGKDIDDTVVTSSNILSIFDEMMLKMDNKRVPVTGRVLYVTNELSYVLKDLQTIVRNFNVQSNNKTVDRQVSRIDEVEIIPVPAELMKTAYDFTEGWTPDVSAAQINMLLIHPNVVITPVSYTFAQLEAPSALSEGKWVYYEESFEDVFILNKKASAIQFNITAGSGTTTTT